MNRHVTRRDTINGTQPAGVERADEEIRHSAHRATAPRGAKLDYTRQAMQRPIAYSLTESVCIRAAYVIIRGSFDSPGCTQSRGGS